MTAAPPRMPRGGWCALDAFPWADEARRIWRHMTPRERRLVVASARAELAASGAFCRAEDATAAARARVALVLGPRPSASLRFT